MYVPCGHCRNCRSSYRAKWLQRLNLECDASASVLFFTLTYDNQHIPLLTFNRKTGECVSNRSPHDDFNALYELPSFNLKSKIPYVQLSKFTTSTEQFGYSCKSDVQKFLKRLRRALDYDSQGLLSDVPSPMRQVRYFVCSEYGPHTFRPHYHGLLFFRDKRTALAVKQYYLRACWQLCRSENVDVSEVASNAAQYVSKYVSCDTRLPLILKAPVTHTFHLFSRSPTIGVPYLKLHDLSDKLVNHALTYHKAIAIKDGGITDVELPLPSQLYRFFLPKPYKFREFDFNYLVSVYTSAYQFYRDHRVNDDKALVSIGSYLPNYCRIIRDTFGVGSVDDSGHSVTYGDFYDSLSRTYRMYGIPQNRTCLVRGIFVMENLGISPSEYVRMLVDCNTIVFSSSLKFQVMFENYFRSLHYTNMQIFEFLFGDFIAKLPRALGHFSIYDEVDFDKVLSSWHIHLYEFYDDFGVLLPRYLDPVS